MPMVFLLFPSSVILKSLLHQVWVPGQTEAECIRTTQSAVCSKHSDLFVFKLKMCLELGKPLVIKIKGKKKNEENS